jgi:hypothetical protein
MRARLAAVSSATPAEVVCCLYVDDPGQARGVLKGQNTCSTSSKAAEASLMHMSFHKCGEGNPAGPKKFICRLHRHSANGENGASSYWLLGQNFWLEATMQLCKRAYP